MESVLVTSIALATDCKLAGLAILKVSSAHAEQQGAPAGGQPLPSSTWFFSLARNGSCLSTNHQILC